MSTPGPAAVDDYLAGLLLPVDPALERVLARSRQAGLPDIAVSPLQGRLLQLLVQLVGARRVLEVGTLGGYSTIWLARGLPTGGRVVTLEIDPHHAAVARDNLRDAGVADRVEVVVGPAVESLPRLPPDPAYDLVFVDADKGNGATYLAHALRLTRPGGAILVDNVVRRGAVADAGATEQAVVGTRRLLEAVHAEPRLAATVVQTVGAKGHDGFLLARVVPEGSGT